MKKLLNILLFGSTYFKEFPAVSLDEGSIDGQVFFESGEMRFEVSKTHWLLSLEPMVFGVWFERASGFKAVSGKLVFKSGQGQIRGKIELNFTESLSEEAGTLFLFEAKSSEVFYGSPFKMRLIYGLHYKRPGVTFRQFINLAAAFSYPRKVRLVSFREKDYFNMFPMDLVGELPNANCFVFGLRHSNKTLGKIIEGKKLAVTAFPPGMKDEVYQLAKHHSGNPPNVGSLPFEVLESGLFRFPIPETALQYDEVEITETRNLGSHMLLWGSTVNTVKVNEDEPQLHHIHFLAYLVEKTKYKPI